MTGIVGITVYNDKTQGAAIKNQVLLVLSSLGQGAEYAFIRRFFRFEIFHSPGSPHMFHLFALFST